MPRVVPTQVVALIDQMFPLAANEREGQASQGIGLSFDSAAQLRAIVDLIDQIPAQLIVVDGAQYGGLVGGVAAIRTAIEMWLSQGCSQNFALTRLSAFGTLNPVTLIRRALALCPDESPAPGSPELDFSRTKISRKPSRGT